MNRAAIIMILVLLGSILVGCGRSTGSFQGLIEEIGTDSFIVNCTEEMNKGKNGDIFDIGYGCDVQLTDQTAFRDESGKTLTKNDFSSGSTVKVVLTKRVNISGSDDLKAKEIMLLTREK